MLEGPRQIAVLPRSAATTGRGRADIVAMHVSGAPESDGMHWWTNLRGDFQRYGSGDDYDGVISAIAGGVDWSSGNVVFGRSEEHTSELQSLMRKSYAVFCLKKTTTESASSLLYGPTNS